MSELVNELRTIYNALQAMSESFNSAEFSKPLDALEATANAVGKAWGGSWLGYQSRVYYQNLKIPPPGAHFSSEWGFEELFSDGTRGDWVEYPIDSIETEIRRLAGNPDISKAKEMASKGIAAIDHSRDEMLSILRTTKGSREDSFIDKLIEETERMRVPSPLTFAKHWAPSGQLMSRDMIALTQGVCAPPHFSVLADVASLKASKTGADNLASICRRAFSHLERIEKRLNVSDRIGTNVCIGHGRSKEWKDLKDFIKDRMRLPWDEFNRVAVAGVPNTVRLATMLDGAAICFLVLTAEDERADGKLQARMNVVHEIGLFQGRLGFTRAIVMLEEGCEAFSNIDGLGQIRFPKGNVRAAFHDVQLVLEREGLVEAPDE